MELIVGLLLIAGFFIFVGALVFIDSLSGLRRYQAGRIDRETRFIERAMAEVRRG